METSELNRTITSLVERRYGLLIVFGSPGVGKSTHLKGELSKYNLSAVPIQRRQIRGYHAEIDGIHQIILDHIETYLKPTRKHKKLQQPLRELRDLTQNIFQTRARTWVDTERFRRSLSRGLGATLTPTAPPPTTISKLIEHLDNSVPDQVRSNLVFRFEDLQNYSWETYKELIEIGQCWPVVFEYTDVNGAKLLGKYKDSAMRADLPVDIVSFPPYSFPEACKLLEIERENLSQFVKASFEKSGNLYELKQHARRAREKAQINFDPIAEALFNGNLGDRERFISIVAWLFEPISSEFIQTLASHGTHPTMSENLHDSIILLEQADYIKTTPEGIMLAHDTVRTQLPRNIEVLAMMRWVYRALRNFRASNRIKSNFFEKILVDFALFQVSLFLSDDGEPSIEAHGEVKLALSHFDGPFPFSNACRPILNHLVAAGRADPRKLLLLWDIAYVCRDHSAALNISERLIEKFPEHHVLHGLSLDLNSFYSHALVHLEKFVVEQRECPYTMIVRHTITRLSALRNTSLFNEALQVYRDAEWRLEFGSSTDRAVDHSEGSRGALMILYTFSPIILSYVESARRIKLALRSSLLKGTQYSSQNKRLRAMAWNYLGTVFDSTAHFVWAKDCYNNALANCMRYSAEHVAILNNRAINALYRGVMAEWVLTDLEEARRISACYFEKLAVTVNRLAAFWLQTDRIKWHSELLRLRKELAKENDKAPVLVNLINNNIEAGNRYFGVQESKVVCHKPSEPFETWLSRNFSISKVYSEEHSSVVGMVCPLAPWHYPFDGCEILHY